MSKWIDVKQELPPPGRQVIVYVAGSTYATAGWRRDNKRKAKAWSLGFHLTDNVTHWMPLPDPPALPETT